MATRFATNRGRPRKNFESEQSEEDRGTHESILKRSLNLTKEPIDLLLEYRFISESEHRAGLHFRWLHTLRHGVESLTCHTFSDDKSAPRAEAEDSQWRIDREEEFGDLALALKQQKLYHPLCDVLVHQHWPLAMRREHLKRLGHAQRVPSSDYQSIHQIKQALTYLKKHRDLR